MGNCFTEQHNDLILNDPLNIVVQEDINLELRTHFCKWLDIFMKWQVMWVYIKNDRDNSSRNIIINFIGFLFSVSSLFIWSYDTFYDIGPDLHYTLRLIISCFWISMLSICRIMSMYYLWSQFNYPWYNFIIECHHIEHKTHLEEYINTKCTKLSNRLKLYILFSYIIIFIHCGSATFNLLGISSKGISASIDFFLSIFGVLTPYTLFQCIHSVIAFKYEIKLYYLRYALINAQQKVPNFVLISKQYKSFCTEFQTDTCFWNIYMQFLLIQYIAVLWLWADSKNEVWTQYPVQSIYVWIYIISGCLLYTTPFIEFIIASSYLNKQYIALVVALWKYDNSNDNRNDSDDRIGINDDDLKQEVVLQQSLESIHLNAKFGSNKKRKMDFDEMSLIIYNIKDFHYLLHYIPNHKLLVKLVGWKITFYTPIKFIVIFGFAKLISYALYYFYP